MDWPIKLTRRERQLLELVPLTGEPISTNDLVVRYYIDEMMPASARQIVVSRMDGIIKKLNRSNANVRIRKTKRAGPKSINYWIELSA